MAKQLESSPNEIPIQSNSVKFQSLTNSDLVRYQRFIEWQLITLPEQELPYWEREALAVTDAIEWRTIRHNLAQGLAEMKANR